MHLVKKRQKYRKIFVLLASYFFAPMVHAADDLYETVSLETLITNLATQLPQVMLFLTAFSYVMGFFFVWHGILLLKKYAEQRSMMTTEAKLTGPLLFIFVGSAMIYLPSALHSGLTTFWLNPTPFKYAEDVSSEWTDLYNAVFIIVQLIGMIAFIRGLMMLTHLGGQGGQHGVWGRALAHIVGGLFLIDLYDFLQMVFATFGLSDVFTVTP